MAQQKSNDVVFRKIRGRIVPIKRKGPRKPKAISHGEVIKRTTVSGVKAGARVGVSFGLGAAIGERLFGITKGSQFGGRAVRGMIRGGIGGAAIGGATGLTLGLAAPALGLRFKRRKIKDGKRR